MRRDHELGRTVRTPEPAAFTPRTPAEHALPVVQRELTARGMPGGATIARLLFAQEPATSE